MIFFRQHRPSGGVCGQVWMRDNTLCSLYRTVRDQGGPRKVDPLDATVPTLAEARWRSQEDLRHADTTATRLVEAPLRWCRGKSGRSPLVPRTPSPTHRTDLLHFLRAYQHSSPRSAGGRGRAPEMSFQRTCPDRRGSPASSTLRLGQRQDLPSRLRIAGTQRPHSAGGK